MRHSGSSWIDRWIWGWSKPQTVGPITVSIMTKRWYHFWMDVPLYQCPNKFGKFRCYYRCTAGTFSQLLKAKLFGYDPGNTAHECKPTWTL